MKNIICSAFAGTAIILGAMSDARADAVYASYDGSQLGVTIRDVNTLNQYVSFNTGINASGISVAANNDIYLTSANHIKKYSLAGQLLVDMTFPIASINYTGVVVSGNRVFASYAGSQQGFTIRDANTLAQSSYCQTGINAASIAVDSASNVYLASGNHLRKYSSSCSLLVDMTFPDAGIVYTGVAVSGNTVYASYTGSQLGFTIRNTSNLEQTRFCQTGLNAKSIAVDSSNNVYLAAQNSLRKYSDTCGELNNMTFPISSINYTGVFVK